MDMSFSNVCGPPPFWYAALPFLILWPFVSAMLLLHPRTKSPAATAAALVPVAAMIGMTWLSLGRVAMNAWTSGGGRASTSAGIAEALLAVQFGLACAAATLILAGVKRHWPSGDAVVLSLAAATAALFAAAVAFSESMTYTDRPITFAAAGASFAVAAALGAWLLLLRSGRVAARPLRFALVPLVVICLAIGVVSWRQMQHHQAVAMRLPVR